MLKVNDLSEISKEEEKIKQCWSNIIAHLKTSYSGSLELANIWTDDVQKNFEEIKKEVPRIVFVLRRLHSHYASNRERKRIYYKEISDIKNFIHHLRKISAKSEWLSQIHTDLEEIISDLEKAKLEKKASDISYKLKQVLIKEYFLGLPSHRIFIDIILMEDSKEIPGWFTQKDFMGYIVTGFLPMSIFKLNDYEMILKGLLAHEFSHIVLGHNDGFRNRVYGFFSRKFKLFGSKITGAIIGRMEKAADREAIRRGLGNEIYHRVKYFETLAKRYGKDRYQHGLVGYTSEEIKTLINKR